MLKDYYEILGITEFDSADKIKSAYRVLARKWHPDVAGNTSDVLATFKEINEAYEILSDCTKKSEYDRARQFYNYAKKKIANSAGMTKEDLKSQINNDVNTVKNKRVSFPFNWKDIVYGKKSKENFCNEEKNKSQKGRDLYADIEITYLESIEGVIKTVNMLQTKSCPKCNGKRFANGTVCSHCHGKGTVSEYKKFTVKIPKGIKNNSKIRLAGEGLSGKNGGCNGDLYITIHVKNENICKIEGLNIFKTVSITPCEAVLGGNIKVSTPSGTVWFKITAGTQSGQKIRLSGCGVVQNNKIGDMIITVEIKIPENITGEELDLYKKLSEISSVKNRK